MVISPDFTIEKQKNQHMHNFERTAPKFAEAVTPSRFIDILVLICGDLTSTSWVETHGNQFSKSYQ